jgi:signal transduction histidine kinase
MRTAVTRLARRWAHLLIGGALFMPYFLLLVVAAETADPGSEPWTSLGMQLAILAAGLPLVAVTSLLPLVRTLQAAAARALCGVPETALEDGPARGWPARRRTAVWSVAHTGLGAVISGCTLAVPPAVVVLLALPFSGTVRHSRWGEWSFPAAMAPALGLGLLAGLIGAAWAAGALLARLAPVLLGPTPADRLAAAERRAADLAARNRLARELHDSVGHALSAVTLQASAAGRVLDSDPGFAREALAAIEETTRQAVAELDTVLGLLRDGEAASTAPAPTLDDLPRLLEQTRAAGLRIDCAGAPDRSPADVWNRVPAVVSREAYRIVQEGLANALRHAPDRPVRLTLTLDPRELSLTMDNPTDGTGTAARARSGGGRGLRGIAERAALLGGTAEWGARRGRWRLAVRLPLGAGSAGPREGR